MVELHHNFKKLHIIDNCKEKTGYFEYKKLCYWIYISIWGWTQDTEELTEVSVTPTDEQICEEISEVSPNTLCTEEKTAPGIPCTGEQFAGAPLMCQKDKKWYLVGILAWRKGCSTVGQRPRLYDRVAVTSDWARKVMLKLNEANRVPRRYWNKYIYCIINRLPFITKDQYFHFKV